MDTSTAAAAGIRGFLEREPVVWLSTVRPDGTPHLVPTWFWWDGEAILAFSKPGAQKVRNLRANPSDMLALVVLTGVGASASGSVRILGRRLSRARPVAIGVVA